MHAKVPEIPVGRNFIIYEMMNEPRQARHCGHCSRMLVLLTTEVCPDPSGQALAIRRTTDYRRALKYNPLLFSNLYFDEEHFVVADRQRVKFCRRVKDQALSGNAAAASFLKRSEVLGFDNGFVFGGLVVLLAVPFCLLLKPSAHHIRAPKRTEAVAEAEILPD